METYRYFEEQRMLMECLVKGGGGGEKLGKYENDEICLRRMSYNEKFIF